jgi:hypothetical protein
MKKLFLLFISFFAAVTFLHSQTVIKPDMVNGPRMVFESTTYDFGTVVQGTMIDHEFVFVNKGKTPLIINDANSSCSCNYSDYPHEPIKPGGKGIIRAHMDTHGKSNYQDKSFNIYSNAIEGEIALHFTGTVISPPVVSEILKTDSLIYHFPDTPQGKTVELDIHFTNTGNEPLIINNCTTTCGCDIADAPKDPIAPGKSGIIHYHLDTKSKIGLQNKTITLTYNNERYLTIHICGKIIPPEAPH